MRYMLLIDGDERALDDAAREDCPVQPTSMRTSVGEREGKRLVTDGPFAETREQR